MFNRLLKKINKVKFLEFDKATEELEDFVYNNSNFLFIILINYFFRRVFKAPPFLNHSI